MSVNLFLAIVSVIFAFTEFPRHTLFHTCLGSSALVAAFLLYGKHLTKRS